MSSETLREQLQRHPFHPVTLLLPSGKTVVVKNPELYIFSETGRTLIVTEGERFIFVDVATVEAIETTGEPA
ncbi:MAG: hypothetical protein JO295_09590 [Verrucomicrobia bacterium]|nr:hypothetical protein [Verrucomicrobiota bacterium]